MSDVVFWVLFACYIFASGMAIYCKWQVVYGPRGKQGRESRAGIHKLTVTYLDKNGNPCR